MVKVLLNNDEFVRTNLAKLVKKFAHKRVVICRGELFTGKDAVKKARQKFPKATPLSFPVPAPEEFSHLL